MIAVTGLAMQFGKRTQTYKEAAYWFQKAAEAGHAGAQTLLALLFYTGAGGELSHTKAAFWYGKAAEQGDREAQYHLAHQYRYGIGVPEDKQKAIDWYQAAVDQGSEIAIIPLRELKKKMFPFSLFKK